MRPDVNRKRVIEHPDSLSHVVEAITKPESCQIASVVLLNICTEYGLYAPAYASLLPPANSSREPSQLSCITHKGVESIFSNISDPEFNSDLDYYLRILELLLAHKEGKAVAPENALETLLRHLETGEEGFDNTLSLVSILSSLLTTSRFQKLTLKESGLFSRVLDMIERTFELTYDAERKDKDKSLIAYARSQLVEAVGEIATDDEFLTVHDLDGEVMKRVAKWLNLQVSKEELAISACLVYGNIGRSDKVCLELVEKGVHVALFEVIEDTAGKFEESVRRVREKKTPEQEAKEKENPPEKLPKGVMAVGIIHAAIGVLKNFAIPQGNKLKLVEAGVFTIIRRLLGLEGIGIAQVWYSAVSLGRLVTINTGPCLTILDHGET